MSQPESIEEHTVSEHAPKQSQRYASVDFLRGAAIFTMVVLHAINDTLDVDDYIARLDAVGFINVFAVLILPYIGGLAGLFLMTSAVGNMIAMRRNLERGHSPNSVMNKQILGGLMVVLFAMVTESTIGYHAPLGDVFKNLNDVSAVNYESALYRGYEIETIHTIGWAIVLNGITQGILARVYDVKTQAAKMIRTYWLLAIAVLVVTPLLWLSTSALIPGYPFETNPNTGQAYFLPFIGKSPWYDFILYFIINPLAAPIEPIFPYLATSYIGSIIGLQLTQKGSNFDKSFVRKYFRMGLFFFVAGFVGVVVVIINVLDANGLDAAIEQYLSISYHREWFVENGTPLGWLWQFLTLNGLSVMLVMLAIRLTEYRGHAADFAKRSTFIRRFGFVAFTIYTAQWIYFIAHFLVSIVAGEEPYARLPWLGTWAIVILSILSFHLIMKQWEKVGYIGSIEWMISGIMNRAVPVKKQASYSHQDKVRWYEIGKLKVQDIFYDADWQNFPTEDREADEKRLIKYLMWTGFLLFPFSIIAFVLTRKLEQTTGTPYRLFRIVSFTGILFFIAWLALSLIFSLSDFGVTL